jgi:hypothetical protein
MNRSLLPAPPLVGSVLGFGGVVTLALIGGPRGVTPAAVFLLSLDVLAVRCVTRDRRQQPRP